MPPPIFLRRSTKKSHPEKPAVLGYGAQKIRERERERERERRGRERTQTGLP
jgi:hypothetical protein